MGRDRVCLVIPPVKAAFVLRAGKANGRMALGILTDRHL